ncbi:MAG: hypothetical protein OQJ93_01250, partial [Ignavibacteriaceae bacterium]|nr:hypothetical protein [Ignavibacteriaceae bacterium]
MKKLLLLIVTSFLFDLSTLAQEGWFIQNYVPVSCDVHNIHVFNSDTAIAVGGSGTIIKTIDCGVCWNYQASGTSMGLRSTYFINDNTGWAVGVAGTIIKTTNGGTNWNTQISGTGWSLGSVYFVDNNTGWV